MRQGESRGLIDIDDQRIDWNAIRAEYIGGGTSYRKLAAKHAVSFMVLKTRAKKEGWPDLRTQAEHKAAIKATQKVANAAASNAAKMERARGLALDRIIAALESMPGHGSSVRQNINKDGKRMTVDYDIPSLVVALERLGKTGIADSAFDDPLMRLLGDLDEQSGIQR